ncbi:branched-chain amino acid ABC transporter permease [uncultured Cohaesibacter sp.]|uniref:branched-chain amino acid ABC transporter permease n=1 Tax=uncultured Cohaesibacter sp. TaxID=1002546 RepID=UPI0029C8B27E|nr:branched-chain amino acid ABC transporter permease [uncultured Cohaesibacter sp.]
MNTSIFKTFLPLNGIDAEKAKLLIWAITCAVTALAFCVLPILHASSSYLFYMALAVTLASGFNCVAGLTGYMPFGYVAFYGVGAYTFGALVRSYESPILLAFIAAGIAGVLLGLLLVPTLRLRGVYFGIVSLALSIICKLIISLLPEEITGGSLGLVIAAANNPFAAYYSMVALMVVTLVASGLLAHSRLGVKLRAIRDDSEAAETLGINVPYTRAKAWLLASLFPACAGALEAWYSNAIDLDSSFNLLITTKTIVYAMAGGLSFVCGPLVGAIGFYVIDQIVWNLFPALNLFFLGLFIVVLVIWLPRGIVGQIAFKRSRLRKYIP